MKRQILIKLIVYLIYLTNANAQWQQISPSPTGMESICFINDFKGFATGLTGKIYKTEDGGLSWQIKYNDTGNIFFDIYFSDNTTGYVVGAKSVPGGIKRIFKTTDAGENWKLLPLSLPDSAGVIRGIHFADEYIGIAVAYSAVSNSTETILRTADGGNTWQEIVVNVASNTVTLNKVRFATKNTAYIVGTEGTILKTTDGGINWTDQSVDTITFNFQTLFFIDSLTGYIAGTGGSLEKGGAFLKTTNGGSTWYDPITSGQTLALFDIKSIAVSSDTIYFVSAQFLGLMTNGGAQFTFESCTPEPSGLTSVMIPSPGLVYAAAGNGIFRKGIPKDSSTMDEPDPTDETDTNSTGIFSNSADNITLSPNPFSNQTYIYTQGNMQNTVLTFSLYDMLGREQIIEKITYPVYVFKRNGLEAGLYLYIIQSKDQVIKTGKLVISNK